VSFAQRVEIPADSPFFAGHFTGHPILPGIAHPLLIARALNPGVEARIAEIPSLKLRSPVRPGEVFDISGTAPEEDGTVRFELRRAGELISQGSLRIAPPDWSGVPAIPIPEEPPGAYPAVSALIPHQPPARLLRDVLDASPETLTGVVEIPAGSPFVTAGRVPAFLGLEAAAQGAAVLEALSRRDDSGPRIGYLVGLRNARCHTLWLPAERPFRIAVRLSGSAASLSIYEVSVEGEGGIALVQGTISTYINFMA
jgi:predicted hotdog family 3-hydroxylacyl-ACP dehydratase